MRVFVLEDDERRIDLFIQALVGSDVTIARSCREVKKFQPPYDVILLDHDLGGRQMRQHEDCGLTFLKMVRTQINPDAIVIIHSYNPVGAAQMQDELPGSLRILFGPGLLSLLTKLDKREGVC